jgi:RNase P subunit RPR2
MRGLALKFQTELITEECCNCHMLFGMTKEFYDERKEKKGTEFFCPKGHSQHYTGESDAQRYKRMLEEANKKNTDLAGRVHGAETARGIAEKKAKRLLKRIRAGVCPHCQRTFSQLARHIESKHPERGKA